MNKNLRSHLFVKYQQAYGCLATHTTLLSDPHCTDHASSIYGAVMFGHQGLDKLVEALEGDIVQGCPARLGLTAKYR